MKKILFAIATLFIVSNAYASNFVVETEYANYVTSGPIVWNSENSTYKFPVNDNGKNYNLEISSVNSAIKVDDDNYILNLDNYLLQVIEGWEYVLEVK